MMIVPPFPTCENRRVTAVVRWIALALLLLTPASGIFAASVPLTQLLKEAERDPELRSYPNLREHIFNIYRRKAPEAKPLNLPPETAALLGGNGQSAVEMNESDLLEFFGACARDRLTILRAMGLVSRAVKRADVLVYMDGRLVRNALRKLRLEMGLALPVDHLELFAYLPDDRPTVQCRFLALYAVAYEYAFGEDILDATLKIGSGKTALYRRPWGKNPAMTARVVEGNIVFDASGVGFVEVKGIGGRKHGILGAFQRALFFLPDAVRAMIIRDGDLHVHALMKQRIKKFEISPQYIVHEIGGVWRNPATGGK